MIVFVVGAIVCATSQDFTQMFVGRVIQGVGGAGIWVLGEVVITDLAPLRERPKWVNFISAAWALGSVSGPLIGGAFATPHLWRWIFWINLPITAVSFVLASCFLQLHAPSGSVWVRLTEVDYAGSFLFTTGLTACLVPLSWGDIQYPWSSWHTILPLVLGVFVLALFTAYSIFRRTEHSFIPARIFCNRSVFLAYLGIFIQGVFLFSILYYLPLYYEGAKLYSPIIAGVAMFPETFTIIPAAMIAGGISADRGTYRWANWAGWALACLGAGLLWLLDWQASIPKWVFINLVVGLGLGLLYPGTVIAVMASCPQEHVAIAAGMSSFFRTVGQAIGVVIGGPIFQNRLRDLLSEESPELAQFSVQYSSAATDLVQIVDGLTPGPARDSLRVIYADALKPLWATMCGLAGLALLSSLALEAYTMDQPLLTDQGFLRANEASRKPPDADSVERTDH